MVKEEEAFDAPCVPHTGGWETPRNGDRTVTGEKPKKIQRINCELCDRDLHKKDTVRCLYCEKPLCDVCLDFHYINCMTYIFMKDILEDLEDDYV